MPTQLQFRRGSTAQNNAFTGAAGEISIDETLDTIRVHDGTTAGGFEITQNTASQTLTNKTLTSPTINSGTVGTALTFNAQADARFADSDSSNWVAFQAPATISSNITWTLPSADGSSGQALVTDGSGTLSWAAAGATISSDTTTNSNFLLYFASSTTGALTAVKQDSGLTYNPSTGTLASSIFSGTATSARYADLAERYISDIEYTPGTVVCLGGDAEVTQSVKALDKKVLGIVSTNPAYLMNKDLENSVAVALTGRVPCKVIGAVSKGDMLVSSSTPGYAMAWNDEGDPPYGTVIGKSIENKDSSAAGVIEVAVGIK